MITYLGTPNILTSNYTYIKLFTVTLFSARNLFDGRTQSYSFSPHVSPRSSTVEIIFIGRNASWSKNPGSNSFETFFLGRIHSKRFPRSNWVEVFLLSRTESRHRQLGTSRLKYIKPGLRRSNIVNINRKLRSGQLCLSTKLRCLPW